MTSFFREVLIDFLHSRVCSGLGSAFCGEVFVFILWWSVVLDAELLCSVVIGGGRAVEGSLGVGHGILHAVTEIQHVYTGNLYM